MSAEHYEEALRLIRQADPDTRNLFKMAVDEKWTTRRFAQVILNPSGNLGVIEGKCGGAHWPLEYFPERHCGGCGAAL